MNYIKGGNMAKAGNSGSNEIFNDYRDLFENAENIATRLYRAYKGEFILNSIYKDDLKQEVMLTTFQVIKNNIKKPKEDLTRLVNKSVGQKVRKIRYKCLSELYNSKTVHDILYNTKVTKKKVDNKIKIEIEKRQEEIDKVSLLLPSEFPEKLNCIGNNSERDKLFNFNEIKGMVSEEGYAILYKYYVEQLNFREIGEEMSMSKQAVHRKYQYALSRVKKIMGKQEGAGN